MELTMLDPIEGKTTAGMFGGEKMLLARQLSSTSTAPPDETMETPTGDRCLMRMLSSTSTTPPATERLLERDEALNDESPRLCIGLPPMESELGKWAQWAVHWEEGCAMRGEDLQFDDDGDSECADSDSFVDDSECGHSECYDAAGEEPLVQWPPVMPWAPAEAPRLCIGLPAIQSELGKWAQWAVRWEEGCATRGEDPSLDDDDDDADDDIECGGSASSAPAHDDMGEDLFVQWPPTLSWAPRESPRLCLGLPPMQSELGKWAQWAVRWEEGCAMRGGDPSLDDDERDDADEECDTTAQAEWPPVLLVQPDDAPRICMGTPMLQSDLARSAQWADRFDEAHGGDTWYADDSDSDEAEADCP
mmetsp:Transcript_28054/g.80607  ORF Transcript_28054/g.80607 Transcript_28054/m.80607 type:complete len:362 (+) Transcript_28054:102-1187(+)